MSWTKNQLTRLEHYQEEASLFSVMHMKAASYCAKYSKRLSVPGAALGAFGTGFAIWGEVQFLSPLCYILGWVATSIKDLYKFEERRSNHTNAADAWKLLYMDMDKAILSNEKPDFDKWFEKFTTRYNQLRKSSPIIPDSIIEGYYLDVQAEAEKMLGIDLDKLDDMKEAVIPVKSNSDVDFFESWEANRKKKKMKEYQNIARIASIRQKISHSFDLSSAEVEEQKRNE